MADFQPAVIKTIAREGGDRYTETPGDTGGGTKYGISKRAYPELDIRNLTQNQAESIYRRDYWDLIKGDQLTAQAVAENLFDTAVNMGVSRAVKLAQMVLGIKPEDGKLGPHTLDAINAADPNRFLADFTLAKVARYVAICNKDRGQSKFLLGWLNRAMGGVA
ncbi:hypothetical protein KSF73_06225 [Burkholderiaceae bacterium DAT-1]|nr:hypothetical protein [Burkholderiaceae bacterium DAT-1]